jgi:hypothetical protein
MRVSSWQVALCAGVAVIVLADAGDATLNAAPSINAADAQTQTINHVSPRPDSQGPQPKRLEWTAVKGADSYSVGVWNEVDVRMWKVSNLKTNAVDWPEGLDVEPGTYFWSIMAIKDERPIADSGLAAFIVVR